MRCFSTVIAGLILWFSTVCAHADASVTRNLFQVSTQILTNGLHVIRHHRDISDTFTAQLIVDVGLQDFNCTEQQLPHLLEHMLFEGTARFDRQTLRQRIRDLGGNTNAFTTEEYTHYTFDIHSDYPEMALDTLFSMVSEPLFKAEHLTTSRQVIHAEQGTSSNTLQMAVSGKKDMHKIALARIWAGSRLECPELTVPDGISLARIKSVFDQYYVASNMTLVLIGHFDDSRIDRALTATLAQLPVKPMPVREPAHFANAEPTPAVVRKGLFDPEVDVSLYIRTVGTTHPDYPALEIAAEYLGEQLFYKVRGEKGLGYTPNAIIISNSDFGFLRATTKTTDQWQDQVTSLFRQVYDNLRHDGISTRDVNRLRQKLILEFESKQRDNAELAQYYRHFRHVIRTQGTMPDLIERLSTMDAGQVNAILQRDLPPVPLQISARPPSSLEVALRVGPVALLLGGLGILLLRWSHRRRQQKTPP